MASQPTGEIVAGETAQRMEVIPAEVARRGWFVMIPGDVFHATCQLLEKLERDGSPNAEGQRFVESLRRALVESARPYRPKNQVVPASKLPGLP